MKPRKYWKCWENLEKEIVPLIKGDVFPTLLSIRNNVGNGASYAIRYYGGINAVAEKMGYFALAFYKTSDGHYVRSFNEFVFDEFLYSRSIPHEVDGLIGGEEKYRYDFKVGDLYFEIWGFAKNAKSSRGKVYFDRRAKKERYYKQNNLKCVSVEASIFERTNSEIERYLEFLFIELGFNVDKKLNIDCFNIPKRYDFQSRDSIYEEIKRIMDCVGKIPAVQDLKDLGKKGIIAAVRRIGMNNLLKEMGLKDRSSLCDNQIIEGINKFIGIYGKFPTERDIRGSCDFNKLYSSITHGRGFKYFRGLFDLHVHTPRRANVWTEEIILNELNIIEDKFGYIPTREMISKEKCGLISAIDQLGGITYFKRRLDGEVISRDEVKNKNRVWTEEKILIEIERISRLTGMFPTCKYLQSIGESKLARIISKYGGFRYYQNLLGIRT